MTAISLPTLSLRAISRLCGLDRDYIIRRINGAKPAGKRAGHPVYALEEVLPLLCRPGAIGSEGEIDPDRLNPTDRKAWYDSELRRRTLQERMGELIPASEVTQAVSTAFATIANDLRAIPDNLERHGEATAAQAERIERAIDAAMDALAERLRGLSEASAGTVSTGRS